MSRNSQLRLVDPRSLPNVWRVEDLASEERVISSGHSALDPELPGGGWPIGSMIELLQQRSGQHLWQLLLPCLAQAVALQTGPVVLVGAPYQPFGPCLKAQGLPADRLLCVRADKNTTCLWAAEQSLRCAEVAAVLAWLPQAKNEELRRLHMAAQQHDRLLFVMRGVNARQQASPARLRLELGGVDTLEIRILKRRGPPLESVLSLPAHSQRLSALLETRRRRSSSDSKALGTPHPHRRSHVLDCTAAFT